MRSPSGPAHRPSYEPGALSIASGPRPTRRPRVQPATLFRSTWIISSQESLRNGGYYDRYLTGLGPHREEIVGCLAGTWLSIDLVREHYEACEALGLTDAQYAAMTEGDGGRTRNAWLSKIVAIAAHAGATPWTVLPFLRRVWHRSADGGRVDIERCGPTQARVDYSGCALFEIAYFRRAVGLRIRALAGRVASRPSVSLRTGSAGGLRRELPGVLALRMPKGFFDRAQADPVTLARDDHLLAHDAEGIGLLRLRAEVHRAQADGTYLEARSSEARQLHRPGRYAAGVSAARDVRNVLQPFLDDHAPISPLFRARFQ
jgi:hypothetical protein